MTKGQENCVGNVMNAIKIAVLELNTESGLTFKNQTGNTQG